MYRVAMSKVSCLSSRFHHLLFAAQQSRAQSAFQPMFLLQTRLRVTGSLFDPAHLCRGGRKDDSSEIGQHALRKL